MASGLKIIIYMDLFNNGQNQRGRISAVVKHPDGRFSEVLIPRFIDIHELLRVTVHQREPAALHLDHKLMAFFESMCDIRQGELYLLRFIRLKGYRRFKTLPELPSHDLSTNQHLVATHGI